LLLGGGYTRLLARRPNGKGRAAGKRRFRFLIEAREGRCRVEIYKQGSVYPFSPTTTAHYHYAVLGLNRWLSAGYATQAATEWHNPLSTGFISVFLYPDSVTGGQLRQALNEAVGELLASPQKNGAGQGARLLHGGE
jgi:hypothetical protein